MLRPAFARVLKRARYVGLEASEYLCRRFGWMQGSIVDFQPATPFDLVVCYDVLQYLDDRAAVRAMANLGRLSRVALYFSALTIEDWRRNCDRSRTDRAVNMRPAAWYRAACSEFLLPRLRRLDPQTRRTSAGRWNPKARMAPCRAGVTLEAH
jgi:hypothetical protein